MMRTFGFLLFFAGKHVLLKSLSYTFNFNYTECFSYQDTHIKLSSSDTVITSESRTFRAPISDEITLPCDPVHLGKFVLVWKHNDEVLTAGSMMVTPDSRFALVGGYNLRIRNIKMKDKGAYTCSISTFEEPVTVTHRLDILGDSLIFWNYINSLVHNCDCSCTICSC